MLRSRGVPGCRVAAVATCAPSSSSRCRQARRRRAGAAAQLAEKRGEQVNPPEKGLFSRIKSAFS